MSVLGMHDTFPRTHQIFLWQSLRKHITLMFVSMLSFWKVAGTTAVYFQGTEKQYAASKT